MKKFICLPLIVMVTAACETGYYAAGLNPMHDFPTPKLLSKPEKYDAMDYNTFPVYKLNYTLDDIRPQKLKDTKAIWLTKDATYLVTAYRQHWEMMYFHMPGSRFIQDDVTQERHFPIKTIGLPTDTTFWVKGDEGQWNVFVTVYPPLPKDARVIQICDTAALDRIPGTTGWAQPEILGLSIDELVKNQALFLKEEPEAETVEYPAVEILEYHYMKPGRAIHALKNKPTAETTE